MLQGSRGNPEQRSSQIDLCSGKNSGEGMMMTLDELKQIKQSLDNGVIISRSQWVKVLDAAIAAKSFQFGQTYHVPEKTVLLVDEKKAGLTITGYDQHGNFVVEKV
jgi:hypothetical protein